MSSIINDHIIPTNVSIKKCKKLLKESIENEKKGGGMRNRNDFPYEQITQAVYHFIGWAKPQYLSKFEWDDQLKELCDFLCFLLHNHLYFMGDENTSFEDSYGDIVKQWVEERNTVKPKNDYEECGETYKIKKKNKKK